LRHFHFRVRSGTVSALRPLVNVTIGFVSGVAIALLKLAAELLSLAGDGRQVIIGELPPFLFDFPFQLLPISFNAIPIHHLLLSQNVAHKPSNRNANREETSWTQTTAPISTLRRDKQQIFATTMLVFPHERGMDDTAPVTELLPTSFWRRSVVGRVRVKAKEQAQGEVQHLTESVISTCGIAGNL